MIHTRNILSSELDFFYKSFEDEGFVNEKNHLECLYKSNKDDFFVALVNENIVGFILAIKDSEKLGIISNFLIFKKYRNIGYAKKLFAFAMEYLQNRQIMINSIHGKEGFYEKFSFKTYFKTSLYLLKSTTKNIVDKALIIQDVNEYIFIKNIIYSKCLFNSKNTHYKAIYKDKRINSFAIKISYKDGYKLLVSSQDIKETIALIAYFLKYTKKSTPLYMEIAGSNLLLLSASKLLKMKKLSSTSTMYNKVLN